MERAIERLLFASRWLMAPMYLGLAATLAVLLWAFGLELWHFVLKMPSLETEDVVLIALKLIDITLAANLLLMVVFSGYENFVSKMQHANEHEDRPDWQGEIDFSGMKLKLIASIVAISGIHLLQVFMDIEQYDSAKVQLMIVIHLVFVVSGVLLAGMDWITGHAKTLKKPKYDVQK